MSARLPTATKARKSLAKRRRPQQQRARDTVEAMLDAVVKLLKRDGLGAVTTNRIAAVAGVSIGSVYQYFPDKRAIYLALHERHVAQAVRLVDDILSVHRSSSLEDLVGALVGGLVDAHASDPHLYELLLTEIPHRANSARPFEDRLREALLQAARKHAPRRSLERKLFMIVPMLDALVHAAALRRPPGLSLAAATDEATHAILSYMRARRRSPARKARW